MCWVLSSHAAGIVNVPEQPVSDWSPCECSLWPSAVSTRTFEQSIAPSSGSVTVTVYLILSP